MKIYPGKNKIIKVSKIDLNNDIPLAYIDTKNKKIEISSIDTPFDFDSKEAILPYEQFEDMNIKLFDETGMEINNYNNILHRNQSRFMYIPQNAITFSPLFFNYNVIIKKNMIYSSAKDYDIKITTIDDSNKLIFSEKLLDIFGDSNKRYPLPHNVFINNRSTSLGSLLTGSIKDSDFIFTHAPNGLRFETSPLQYISPEEAQEFKIEYQDGYQDGYSNNNPKEIYNNDDLVLNNYKIGYDKGLIDNQDNKEYNDFYFQIDPSYLFLQGLTDSTHYNITDKSINNSTNLWITFNYNDDIESHDIFWKNSNNETLCNIKNPIAIKTKSLITKQQFDLENIREKLLLYQDEIIIHNIFNVEKPPILILEVKNKNFIVISEDKILDTPDKYYEFIYETLLYVHLNSYSKSKSYSDWITDKMPDYIIVNNQYEKRNKFSSSQTFYKMFGLEKHEAILKNILIDSNLVESAGLADDHIIFQKKAINRNDPVKPENFISVFTPTQEIMFYKKSLYKINESVLNKISSKQLDNNILVKIEGFKLSQYGVATSTQTFTIPIHDKYLSSIPFLRIFIYNKENILEWHSEKDSSFGLLIATITIKSIETPPKFYDIRQRGGGLPITEKDNFNLLDIGHIYGRPYRKGGTLVIKMPKKYKQYHELILETIKKHMIAEDFPVILYK